MTRLYTRLNTSKMTRLIQHLIGLIIGSPRVCSPLSGMLCKVPAILTECTNCRQYFTDTYTVMRT